MNVAGEDRKEIEEKVKRVYAEIRACMILVGGSEPTDGEISMMSVGAFLYQVLSNGIKVKVMLDPNPRV